MRAESGHANVMVGFFVPWAAVVAALAYERAEEAHDEPRFDGKTGQPVEPERVVDVEGGRWLRVTPEGGTWPCVGDPDDSPTAPFEFEGYDIPGVEPTPDLFKELSQRVGCEVSYFGGGETWYVAFDILPPGCEVSNTSYDLPCDFSAGSALSFGKVVEAMTSFKAQEVRDRLRGMGLEVGEVLIFPALGIQD